jgi:hypothetical protein
MLFQALALSQQCQCLKLLTEDVPPSIFTEEEGCPVYIRYLSGLYPVYLFARYPVIR